MPKVSVIIPTYNREKYIVETLQSVFAQTFTDYEVIVIDDGSTDNTADVLKPYLDRIIYIRKPNGGQGSARNAGIKIAKGEYIAFLDSDDLWLPEKLEKQVKYLDVHHEIGLVFTDYVVFGENIIPPLEKGCKGGFNEDLSFKRLFRRNFIPTLTVMVRKDSIESVGYFDETRDLIGCEDYEMWLRIAMRFRLGQIPEILAQYRHHSNNIVGTTLSKNDSAHVIVINKILLSYPHIPEELNIDMNEYYRNYYYCSGRNLYQEKQYRPAIEFLKRSLGYKRLSPKALILYGLSRLHVLWSNREAAGREL